MAQKTVNNLFFNTKTGKEQRIHPRFLGPKNAAWRAARGLVEIPKVTEPPAFQPRVNYTLADTAVPTQPGAVTAATDAIPAMPETKPKAKPGPKPKTIHPEANSKKQTA
jgi:hypothetical protein